MGCFLKRFTSDIISNLGWGKIEIKKMFFKEKKAIIILRNSALPLKYKLLYREKSKEPIDYWLLGILKKHFSVIFETEMEIEETKCMAMDDPYCEFVVKPKS